MATYHIYCDESCHLQNDASDVMVLGAVTCPAQMKRRFYEDLRKIKIDYGLSSWFEIKWTKVSESKKTFYGALIDYFFSSDLSFRGVVATNKSKLDHSRYNQGSYDLWYYKMYFLLLDPLIQPLHDYRIFIDIKDTKGGPKVKRLHEVLCNNIYDFKQEVVKDIKLINSKESELLQLADLFIGALSYYHRGIYNTIGSNSGKNYVIDHLVKKYGVKISASTSRYENKFNIFIWSPQGV